jgi:heat shock protein HslJ
MTIEPGPMTMMACPEGSFADQYVTGLAKTDSYALASGALTLNQNDGGTLTFK